MGMSMRSRGAAAAMNRSRSGLRPAYEDFKPNAEWKHEETADILLLHLPGFVKEKIKIIAQTRGILTVRGEHRVVGNKWNRFKEEVIVPQGCNMSEIRAKFEGAILRITIPKKIITTHKNHIPEEQSAATPEHPRASATNPDFQTKPQNLQEEFPSAPTLPSNMAKPQVGTSTKPPYPTLSPGSRRELEPKNFQDDIPSKHASSSVPRGPKDLVGKEVIDPNLGLIDDSKQSISDNNFHQEIFDYRKKYDAQDHARQRDLEDRKNGVDQHGEDEDKRILTSRQEHEIKEEAKDDKMKAKSHLPRSMDENRQLLVNMGAAILVIMALGTYMSYSFGSYRQANY